MNPFTNCKVIGDGIDYDTYAKQEFPRGDAQFVMTRGELMDFADCPSKWLKGVEDDGGKGTEWGDLLDALVLSPAKAEMRFAVSPEKYPDGKGGEKAWTYQANYCKTWREEKEKNGLKIVSDADMKRATSALEVLKRDADIMDLIDCSKTQVMVTGDYVDRETKLTIPVKGLIDLVPDVKHPDWGKDLSDLKTATCARIFELGRAINTYHYDAQAYLYKAIYTAATGEDRTDWQLIVQESSEPYQPELYAMSGYFIENGETKIIKALKLYCWCLKNSIWPSYRAFARLQLGRHRFIEPEDWMISRLADFCAIPEMNKPKPQFDGDIPH